MILRYLLVGPVAALLGAGGVYAFSTQGPVKAAVAAERPLAGGEGANISPQGVAGQVAPANAPAAGAQSVAMADGTGNPLPRVRRMNRNRGPNGQGTATMPGGG